MLDLIGLGLLAKHANRVAEAKEQRASLVVVSTVVAYVGMEALGALRGLATAGLQGAVLGAFCGAAIAATLILLLLHFALPDRRAQAQGLAPRTGQLVGESCAVCQVPIASTIGAGRCHLCDAPCHDDCTSQHVKQSHRKSRKRPHRTQASV